MLSDLIEAGGEVRLDDAADVSLRTMTDVRLADETDIEAGVGQLPVYPYITYLPEPWSAP